MMKKTLLMILSLAFLFVIGCTLKTNPLKIENITLDSENRGFMVRIAVKEKELPVTEDKILGYGVAIVKKEAGNASEITIETSDRNPETDHLTNGIAEVTFGNMIGDDFTEAYSFRAYLRYQNEKNEETIFYDDTFKTISLYELAKTAEGEFAEEILDYTLRQIIRRAEITLDRKAKTVVSPSENYQASYQTQEDKMIITVTCTSGYQFSETAILVINNETVHDNLTVTAETLVYEAVEETEPGVPVNFQLNGGLWKGDILKHFEPEIELTAASFKDIGGNSYTIIDNKERAFRDFYKIFVKYDTLAEAYKVVAANPATSSIALLGISDYDYILAVHDYCLDTAAYDAIKAYSQSENTIGMYVLFGSDITAYQSGTITTAFYQASILSQNWTGDFHEGEALPVIYKDEFQFSGWTDGTAVYHEFPKYENTESVTYQAVWASLSAADFRRKMDAYLPNTVTGNLTLPEAFSGFAVTWTSSRPDILSYDGTYTKPTDLIVNFTLTATLTSETDTIVQTYEMTAIGYKTLGAPGTAIASSYIYRDYTLTTDEFFETLDIINCAFVTALTDGSLDGSAILYNVQNYILPKAHAKGDWVVFSIAPESSWSMIAASPTKIERLADSIVAMINDYGFDGVDIDWETPKDEEKESFTAMMKVIYEKVKANNPLHIVSAAISGGMWQPPRYDLINSAKYIDYINMMTYQMVSNGGMYQNALYSHATFDNQQYQAGKTLTSCSIDESVALFRDIYHIPLSKIIVGVAFYGVKQKRSDSGWGNGTSVFYTFIEQDYLHNSDYTAYYDDIAQVPYILKNDGTEFISYDNPESIEAKSRYVLEKKLGGIMYWENGCDHTGELLAAMKIGLNK